ncbi:MAG: DNA-deoxyinosine glycosylase [Lachnospiraceae bacterium]
MKEKEKKQYTHIIHPFPPLYDSESEILILGSFPSVKSREQKFFYGHKQNRFWKVMAAVLETAVPETIEEKKKMLYRHHIALWDSIYSCDIIGSSDSSIKNAVPTDLGQIITGSKIRKIFCNGAASGICFKKYQEKELQITADVLPSTSPANAAYSLEKLISIWRKIKEES